MVRIKVFLILIKNTKKSEFIWTAIELCFLFGAFALCEWPYAWLGTRVSFDNISNLFLFILVLWWRAAVDLLPNVTKWMEHFVTVIVNNGGEQRNANHRGHRWYKPVQTNLYLNNWNRHGTVNWVELFNSVELESTAFAASKWKDEPWWYVLWYWQRP